MGDGEGCRSEHPLDPPQKMNIYKKLFAADSILKMSCFC